MRIKILFVMILACSNSDFSFAQHIHGLQKNFNLFGGGNNNFTSSCAFKKNRSDYSDLTSASQGNVSDFSENLNINANIGFLREIEELYNTNSFYQSYNASKRFSELFSLSLALRLDYAYRDEIGLPRETRWFDNTLLKAEFDVKSNSFFAFVSGSVSDTTLTSYGVSANSIIELSEVEINNKLTLAYDYFYYWNQVGQNFAEDNVQIIYKNFTLSTGYFFGVVDFNYVDGYEEKAQNPNSLFNIGLQYRILSEPIWNFGISYNMRNFKYYSPLYFSPQDRGITGIYSSFFNYFGKMYVYCGGGISRDNYDVNIWNFDGEVGYETDSFNIAIGLGRYNDPYYTNYNTFINISKTF